MNRLLHHAAFVAGLIALAWVGAGYVPQNPYALALVVVIAGFYVAGAAELHRFHAATTQLARAVDATAEPPPSLEAWLAGVPAALVPAVRLRVEGERAGLPGPAMAPYLTGLLVLLGMLGTFLGMVATLQGTGLALESAANVDAIRASLAAPVKGLSLAFGTSVAGVAASAMLGLMAALVRRERQRVARRLDVRIAGTLRGFSQAHHRDTSLALLGAQATAWPALVTQLEALVERVAQQGASLEARLAGEQARFHAEAERAYTGLAEAVDRSLRTALADSARQAGAAIAPAVQAALNGLAAEAGRVQATLADAVHGQIAGVTERLDTVTATLAGRWDTALADQRRHQEAAAQRLAEGLDRFTATFEARAGGLVDGVAARLDRTTDTFASAWGDALAQQRAAQVAAADEARAAWVDARAALDAQAMALLQRLADARAAADTDADAREAARAAALHAALDGVVADVHRRAIEADAAQAERLQDVSGALEGTARGITTHLDTQARALLDALGGLAADLQRRAGEAEAAHAAHLDAFGAALERTAEAVTTRLDTQARATLDALGRLADEVQRRAADAEAAHAGRLDAIGATLERTGEAVAGHLDRHARATLAELGGLAADVHRRAAEAADADAARQQATCATLERTGAAITARLDAQAQATLGEVARLLQAAADAPRAAAEVIGELRTALSDSLVRDNAALAERNRLLATLDQLLDAVQHAGTAQRAAVDELVRTTTDVLHQAGQRFAESAEREARTLAAVAADVAGSSAELAGVGEGFGAAVDRFGQSADQLLAQLQRIEAALGQSAARSDEQLAYYVAQAREIVDLTLGSQQQIVADLQRLGRAPAEAPAP